MIGLKVTDGIVENVAVFNSIPDGWIESPQGVGIGWTDNGDGTFSAPLINPPTDDELAVSERMWRDSELRVIDIEVLKAEDNGNDASAFRAHRQSLREYPQQGDFPYGARPVA